MDKIIPLRLDEAMAGQVDRLVTEGIFRSRNEGIRAGVREVLRQHQGSRSARRAVIAKLVANHLMQLHGDLIHAIVLFGSVANARDTEYSDIDVFVLTRQDLNYDEEGKMIEDMTELMWGVDELVSLQSEPIEIFSNAIRRGFEFETNIHAKGIVLAGAYPPPLSEAVP
jgi:Arc/MetJ-type ribon-helix-helix transcriptional regulator